MNAITNYYEDGADGGRPESLVILLHGVGSNGRDLISLAPYWAKYVPGARFVSPDAPFPCDMAPPGYPGSYQWFSLLDRDPHAMLEGVKAAFPLVENFVEEQLKRLGVLADKCALAGFSQGTMMSLYAAPRLKDKIAGVLGYSGALLWEDTTDMHKMPVHLIHGESDDVVPVQAFSHAKETLTRHGFPVSGHTTPGLAHSIDERGIESGGEFLRSVLGG